MLPGQHFRGPYHPQDRRPARSPCICKDSNDGVLTPLIRMPGAVQSRSSTNLVSIMSPPWSGDYADDIHATGWSMENLCRSFAHSWRSMEYEACLNQTIQRQRGLPKIITGTGYLSYKRISGISLTTIPRSRKSRTIRDKSVRFVDNSIAQEDSPSHSGPTSPCRQPVRMPPSIQKA